MNCSKPFYVSSSEIWEVAYMAIHQCGISGFIAAPGTDFVLGMPLNEG